LNFQIDNNDFLKLTSNFSIDAIKVSLNEFKFKNKKILLPLYIYPSRLIGTKKEIFALTGEELEPILMRHLSARALKMYTELEDNLKYLLLMDYPIATIISPYFNAQSLYKKI